MKKQTLATLFAALCILSISGCTRQTEQDIQTILASDLLQAQNIPITIPDPPYYPFRDGRLAIETALHVPGRYANLYFTPGGWTDERIAELVHVTEDGMRFAADMLGIPISEPLSFVFNVTQPGSDHPFPIWNGGGVLGTSTYISIPARHMPALIVHEAVHAILRYADRVSNFPMPPETFQMAHAMFLEEGLANVIEFLFYAETDHEYFIHGRSNRRRIPENYLHNQAIRMQRHFNNFEDAAQFGTRYPQLMSYDTAASFVYFLITYHGTMADFMQVFDDIDLMETVYSANMETMIGHWLAYLDGLR